MAFDARLESNEDFVNDHDFETARKRLIEAQRSLEKFGYQPGLFGKEICIDYFCGAGGASLGLKWALGRDPDICVNHDPAAIACHALNTPSALHFTDDVFHVDLVKAVAGRPVGVFWMSPTCIHFSSAKGGEPLNTEEARRIRGLAWVGVRVAKTVRPRIIMCENVPGFLTWARIGKDGRVDKSKIDKKGYGEYFKKWVRELRRLGYAVEWKVIKAADYGSPTIRSRVYIIARCDGLPIVWPQPTHAPLSASDREIARWAKNHGLGLDELQGMLPHRTAAECIDWSIKTVSIFASKKEGRKQGVKRPLAPPTLHRIAKGIVRFVLAAENPYIIEKNLTPFIATLNHTGEGVRGQRVDEPKKTICAARDAHGIVVPHVTLFHSGSVGAPVTNPMNAITSGQGAKRPAGHAHSMGLVEAQVSRVATMVQTGYGEREGQPPRALDLRKPLGTAVAGGVKHAIVEASVNEVQASAPIIIAIDNQSSGDGCSRSTLDPLGTIVKENRYAVVESAFIAQQNLNAVGRPANEPIATLTKTGSQQQLVTACLTNFYGSNDGSTKGSVEEPLSAITAGGFHQGLVTAELTGTELAAARRVARFMKRYYKPGKKDPVLVVDVENGTLTVGGRTFRIFDVALRMMMVPELKRAQGFPDSYRLDPVCEYRTEKGTKFGPLPQSEQVAKIGNSVCPQVAEALALANLFHEKPEQIPQALARRPRRQSLKMAA